jgi:pyrroloquinoline quinone biosynthesis protein B
MVAMGGYCLVLGTAQDGGYPQAGCHGACCRAAWEDPRLRRRVACLGIVEPATGDGWLIDATPDFPAQLFALEAAAAGLRLRGILLTHGHVGHYCGLAHLGREAMDARGVSVFAMPRMRQLLAQNEPWAQLLREGHMTVVPLADGAMVQLSPQLVATPIVVPHRDELTETVGYRIAGRRRTIAYVPDVDSWLGWEDRRQALFGDVAIAYVDGTFFSSDELSGRDQASVAHPTMGQTMEQLTSAAGRHPPQFRFLHLNHTNPALGDDSDAAGEVRQGGFAIAAEGEREPL